MSPLGRSPPVCGGGGGPHGSPVPCTPSPAIKAQHPARLCLGGSGKWGGGRERGAAGGVNGDGSGCKEWGWGAWRAPEGPGHLRDPRAPRVLPETMVLGDTSPGPRQHHARCPSVCGSLRGVFMLIKQPRFFHAPSDKEFPRTHFCSFVSGAEICGDAQFRGRGGDRLGFAPKNHSASPLCWRGGERSIFPPFLQNIPNGF